MYIQALIHNVSYVLGVAAGYYLAMENWTNLIILITVLMVLCVMGHVVDTERVRSIVKEEGGNWRK
jgi:4-hydroxybenzoate polyprenyltransferase